MAVAIGPLLGGVLTSGLSWRWIFFVNLPVGIAAIALTLTKVDRVREPTARRPDWAGFATFTLALASLVYGLIESNQRSFTDGLVIGCLVAAGVLLVAFVLVEMHGPTRCSTSRCSGCRHSAVASVAAFGLSASIFAMFLYLVLYLQDILRLQCTADRHFACS